MSTEEPTTSVCSKCKQTKPLTDFAKEKKRKLGISYWCKQCLKELRVAWLKKFAGTPCLKCGQRPRLHYSSNCAQCQKAYQHEQFIKHRKKFVERSRRYNQLHKREHAISMKIWRKRNKEAVKKSQADSYQRHKIKRRESQRLYYLRKKQKIEDFWRSRLEAQVWHIPK